jgi:acetyl esterase
MSISVASEVRFEDIEYRPGLLARLYHPAGTPPFPSIVEVHGGAWVSSDRLNNAGLALDLARDGIMTLSLDFRMPPEAAYPASLQDINYAIRWFKQRAADFGARAERIGLYGTSSGGHQAMLTAMRPNDPRYAALPLPGGPDATVAFVISGWGILCPWARYQLAQQRGDAKMLANHHAFWRDEAEMREGSPLRILERGEPAVLPPAFIFQGDIDVWSPAEIAQRLETAYRAAGGTVELAVFEGEGHTFMRDRPEAPNSVEAQRMLTAFIRRHG